MKQLSSTTEPVASSEARVPRACAPQGKILHCEAWAPQQRVAPSESTVAAT